MKKLFIVICAFMSATSHAQSFSIESLTNVLYMPQPDSAYKFFADCGFVISKVEKTEGGNIIEYDRPLKLGYEKVLLNPYKVSNKEYSYIITYTSLFENVYAQLHQEVVNMKSTIIEEVRSKTRTLKRYCYHLAEYDFLDQPQDDEVDIYSVKISLSTCGMRRGN